MNLIMHAQPWLNPDGSRVRGSQLAGDLAAILSPEEETMPARRALIAMSANLKRATLVGSPAPIVADMGDRLRKPQPGDLVVEDSQGHYLARKQVGDWYRALGVLLLQRREWVSTDGDWRAEMAAEGYGEDERVSEDVTYIQYGPAPEDVCRWHNCEFRMVPIDEFLEL